MAERPIGLVMSDVDGTQVNKGAVSPAIVQAAQELRRRGTPLVQNTARSHALLQKLVVPLDLQNNICVLDGGATIARAGSGEILATRWLGNTVLRTITESIAPHCRTFSFNMETRKQSPQQVLETLRQDTAHALDAAAAFAVFEASKSSKIVGILDAIADVQRTDIMAYDKNSAWRCIQVLSPGVDKRSGGLTALTFDDLASRRKLLIGDGVNDIPLFRLAENDDITVAINNKDTPDELLELADFIAPSVEADGFVYGLREYEVI